MLDLLEAPGAYRPTSPGELRHCSRCDESRPIEDFPIKNKARGLRRVWCRGCCRAYGREHYVRNRSVYLAKAHERRLVERPRIRAWIDDYLRRHPCVDCGESQLVVLDFDHRDRSQKDLTVAELARLMTWSRLRREVEKCDVRCANCHRRRTAAQLRWKKLRGVAIDTSEVRPGVSGRYSRPLCVPRRIAQPAVTRSPAMLEMSRAQAPGRVSLPRLPCRQARPLLSPMSGGLPPSALRAKQAGIPAARDERNATQARRRSPSAP